MLFHLNVPITYEQIQDDDGMCVTRALKKQNQPLKISLKVVAVETVLQSTALFLQL